MNFTKTRIWGSALLPPAPPQEAEVQASHGLEAVDPPPALDLTKTVVSPPPSLARTVVSPAGAGERPRISPRSGTRIMNLATLLPSVRRASGSGPVVLPDLSDEPVRAPTRVLPIEQLAKTTLAPAEDNFEPAHASADSQRTPTAKPKFALTPLRIATLGIAALTLVMFVMGQLRQSAPAARGASALQPAAAATAQAPTKGSAVVTASAESSARPASEQQDEPLSRAAVDALALGDESSAQVLYQRLSVLHPEQPAYGEAARILRTRLRETP